MSDEAYERLVLLAARRRRGEPSVELEAWIRTDPAAAETVAALDHAAAELDRQDAPWAPADAELAAQRAALKSRIERRQRFHGLRWVAGLAVAASVVFAATRVWRPPIVGRASVQGLAENAEKRGFAVRAGQTLVADAGSKLTLELAQNRTVALRPRASVVVHADRIVVLDGTVQGSSGARAWRVDFADWSLELGEGTLFTLRLAEKRGTLWTDRDASLRHGSDERRNRAGQTTTLDFADPGAD